LESSRIDFLSHATEGMLASAWPVFNSGIATI
jgi:hypothetical protein